MANSQDKGSSQHPDLLAAVVLHTLVNEARDGMTVATVAVVCERNPDKPDDMNEIKAALQLLLEDGLAECEAGLRPMPETAHKTEPTREPYAAHEPSAVHQPLYRATRAAIRATELSF